MASGIIDRALLDYDEPLEISSFRQLFGVWRRLQDRMGEAARAGDAPAADAILSAQTDLMSLAAHLPAKSPEDAVYKLALWRWDSNEIGGDFAALQRGDQILYSVFRDLVAMTGVRDVLTEDDVAAETPTASARPTA